MIEVAVQVANLPRPLFTGLAHDAGTLVARYHEVRRVSDELCSPLAVEDYVIQAMADVSPPRWHLGHVSWFFDAFVLTPYLPGFRTPNEQYHYLFNSYYNEGGPQWAREHRGSLSRPTVAEVYDYRAHVDSAIVELVENSAPDDLPSLASLIAVGLNHDQQHQELLVTDIKYNLSVNPLRPAYHTRKVPPLSSAAPMEWVEFEGGMSWTGHDGNGFAFDNEWPRHETYIPPFSIGSRLVTNEEYLEFMSAGGYSRPDDWLSEGWKAVRRGRWEAPLYWEMVDGDWVVYTLSGMQPVDEHAPVSHVSYYEADAYARWRGGRLPTEHEWEYAAREAAVDGAFLESGVYQPHGPGGASGELSQMFGEVWQWTQSAYTPYPGFRPWEGALGEYNGKFMVNQMVLRGGSCATPRSHYRPTYRNFFPPDARWQFSGIRMADAAS